VAASVTTIRALFLAPTFSQAEFWSRQWGFRRPEWRYVREQRDLEGVRGLPVFVCGPPDYDRRFLDLLDLAHALGLDLIDTQDLDAVECRRVGAFDQLFNLAAEAARRSPAYRREGRRS
jgi:hypothetical protein